MLINTAMMGAVEVDESQVFHVPDGLFGFEGVSRYALITKQDEDVTLRWFQAVDANVPCFVVFSPDEVVNGYRPELEKADLKALACKSAKDLAFYVIAVVPDDVSKTTVNLKSPIAINLKNGTARQVILTNADYPIKFPLVAEVEEPEPVPAHS